jgi:hypothetical protein
MTADHLSQEEYVEASLKAQHIQKSINGAVGCPMRGIVDRDIGLGTVRGFVSLRQTDLPSSTSARIAWFGMRGLACGPGLPRTDPGRDRAK